MPEIQYMFCELEHKIFNATPASFNVFALDVFHFQYKHNSLYRQYADALHTDVAAIRLVSQVPFLPIRFFKTHPVVTGNFTPQAVFESSGTTGSTNSRHLVKDVELYRSSFIKAFERAYGSISNWCIIGLLPSYLERGNSSLVYMVSELVRESRHPQSGFYLYNFADLHKTLMHLEQSGQKTILIGVTFALVAFAEHYPLPLRHTVVMETGGMKGRGRELTRPELHAILMQAFQCGPIHAEYGMTELLSQAYSSGGGIFDPPSWMKILVRSDDDPFEVAAGPAGNASSIDGAINVVDLANLYSCSFIATDDVGRLYQTGQFEVNGRLDNSDLRGCSLMVAGAYF